MTSSATPITDCARGASDRSGFGPVSAVMPPEGASLPARLLGTCGGPLTEDSARRLFQFLERNR